MSWITSHDNLLSGFDVRHAQTIGISLTDSSDNKILKCKVSDCGTDGMFLDNSNDTTIQSCKVTEHRHGWHRPREGSHGVAR